MGIGCGEPAIAGKIAAEAFSRGLIMETAGFEDEVFKLFPAVTIPEDKLKAGLAIIEESVRASLGVKEPILN